MKRSTALLLLTVLIVVAFAEKVPVEQANGTALWRTLKWVEERDLGFPQQVDGTGATLDPVSTSVTFGQAIFSHSTDKATNYVLYRFVVPFDLDATANIQAKLKVRLGAADIGKHAYVLAMANVGDSASADSPTFVNATKLYFTGDAGGASGEIESVGYTTLTGDVDDVSGVNWAASLTPGNVIVVRLYRDGDDGTNDTSTVNSSTVSLTLKIPHAQ